jgi:hypothetical protein
MAVRGFLHRSRLDSYALREWTSLTMNAKLMRLAFEETGGIPGKFAALTELPFAAISLHDKGMLLVLPIGPATWGLALSGEGSAWPHLQFVTPERS